MNTNASKTWGKTMQGGEPDEKMIAACFRDIYGNDFSAMPKTARGGRSKAELARESMIDRMTLRGEER